MCADFRGSTLIKIAEMRRLELVEQAEQLRLAELATSRDSGMDPSRIDLRCAIETLGDRMRMVRRPRSSTQPIDFEPVTESA